jgi:hypothetical protein
LLRVSGDGFEEKGRADARIGKGNRPYGRYRLESPIAIAAWAKFGGPTTRSANTPSQGLLKAEYAIDLIFVQRFRAAAQNAARLAHSGIATAYVHDYDYDYDYD